MDTQEGNQITMSGNTPKAIVPARNGWPLFFGVFFVGMMLAGILIYLTPLRYVNLVPPEIEKIDAAVFYDDYKKAPDNYYFVDVRPSFLRFEYPEGAVNKSIFNLSEDFETFPRDKTIVLFCEEGVSASVAAGFLKFEGFKDVLVIDGGRLQWKEVGLPLMRNTNYNEEASGFLPYFEEGGLLPKKKP